MPKLGWEFFRYFAVSLVALGVDFGALLGLAKVIHYVAAATISFLLGSVAHYFLAVKFVFKKRRADLAKKAEIFLYIAAGGIGLLVNVFVISAAVEYFSMPLPLAKICATGGSFISGFFVRKTLLFR